MSFKKPKRKKSSSVKSRKHSQEKGVKYSKKLIDKNTRTQVCSPTPLGGNIIFLKAKNKTRNTKFKNDLSQLNFFKTVNLKSTNKINSKTGKKPIIQIKPKGKISKKLNERIAMLENSLLCQSFRRAPRLEADTGGSILRSSRKSQEEDKVK
mmetsp:Transcript_5430/g.4598  ORF Transcript_5430/g.4598 Transcript_5430/m.4598 type:complete len:152 (+) Transcript_5430:141-596(+)